MKPLLSIVIPTKNRYKYLKVLIKALLRNENQNFEIIVQDNSDSFEDFQEYINTFGDNRLKYNHTAGWLSVIDNCDLAVGAATGEYVCMLGDDDGVLPWIVDVANWMKRNQIDAIWTSRPHYIWPDAGKGDKFSGSLTLPKYDYKTKEVSVKDEMAHVLKKGGGTLGLLPRVYHTIVSKTKLDLLHKDTGSYFPGPSPDMANACALSKYIDKVTYIDFPIVITGTGYKSTGGQGIRHEHHGKISDKSFLPKDTSKRWSSKVPKFWSGQTIWAESCIRGLKATKQYDEMNTFNYPYLYASALVFQHSYSKYIWSTIKRNWSGIKKGKIRSSVILNYIAIFFIRSITFIKNRLPRFFPSKQQTQKNIVDISAAIDIIETAYLPELVQMRFSIEKPTNK